MKFGVFLPISGRATGRQTLLQAAHQAELFGYDSVWTADRIIIPWQIKTAYPYSKDKQFIVPPNRPFLEPLTCLAFLAGCTERIRLGVSVMVLPYRHPLYWTKIATTIDQLSLGRMILGVGVGWMAEEFEALGIPFKERGTLSDEQLELLERLWEDDRVSFEGKYYRVENIAFYPKPLQSPRIPIWVGGEGQRAQRRAATYGDAWFPYFVNITPRELARRFDNVRRYAQEAGRDGDKIALGCCLPIELTPEPVKQEEDYLMGSTEQVAHALRRFEVAGVAHMALQFMAPRWPERQEQIERFARDVLPAFQNQS